MKKIFYTILITSTLACNKQDDWLEVKSNLSDVTPSTLKDYQALLDQTGIMNQGTYPGLGVIGSDAFYVSYPSWQAVFSPPERNSYIWKTDFYEASITSSDWTYGYVIINYANVVLDGLQKINRDANNALTWDSERGSALFFKAFANFNLLQVFAPQFDVLTAKTDLGIPMRNTSDVNAIVQRSSVYDCYQQILNDLKEAFKLLPASSSYKTRPTKLAVNMFLARIYLQMGDYGNAQQYANLSLQEYSTLIDFNSLSPTSTVSGLPTIQNGNAEIIFYASMLNYGISSRTVAIADSTLFTQYATNDLRRSVYYQANTGGTMAYRGYYAADGLLFVGMSVDEIYLIRAECKARANDVSGAMVDLNSLLIKRWKTGTFTPLTAASSDDAMNKILLEKRKEIPYATRWWELRRLNKESKYAVTLQKVLNGQNYSLPPNDTRYVLPIPPNEISLSGIAQNPR